MSGTDPMLAVADCLDDVAERRRRGDDVRPDDYRGRLGECYAEFLAVLEADTALRSALDPSTMANRAPRRSGRLLTPWRAAVAAALLVAAVFAWTSMRTARLSVECVPVARVEIDGRVVGESGGELTVSPGEHDITLRCDGFEAATVRTRVSAGDEHALRRVLVALDPDDPDTLSRVGSTYGLTVDVYERPAATRSAGEPLVAAVFPRGRVRRGDAATWRVDVTDVPPDGSELRFERDGVTLAAVPFRPEELSTTGNVPPSVLAVLRPGDRVSWGWYPPAGEAVTASFELVEAPLLDERLERIDVDLAGQPRVAAHLRAAALLDADLPQAALRESASIAREHAGSERAWLVMLEALRALGLEGSPDWGAAARALARIPVRGATDR